MHLTLARLEGPGSGKTRQGEERWVYRDIIFEIREEEWDEEILEGVRLGGE